MSLQSLARRAAYYGANIILDALPSRVHQWRKNQFLAELEQRPLSPDEQARLNYYNKLENEFHLQKSVTINAISRRRSFYYYDLKYYANCFNSKQKLRHVFGDVTAIPDEPAIVKSRPITDDNRNSVIMKLDRLRHYYFVHDPYTYQQKRPMAVWRGVMNNVARNALIEAHTGNPYCDVADIGMPREGMPKMENFLSRENQLRYKYIISIEGNDVATNLKWIMASNSLCIMPRPQYETWYAEGMLVPGFHYVRVNDDFSDLKEVIDHYEANPEEAAAIIKNAHAYVAKFRDRRREDLLSYLVLEKYLRLANPARQAA
jgi:hypothetical protein